MWAATSPEGQREAALIQRLRSVGRRKAAAAATSPEDHAHLDRMHEALAAKERDRKTPFTQAEIDLVAEELGPKYGPVVVFASETGMRPSEWLAIEWRDIDRNIGVVLVERTCAYGVTKSYGKTARSRRRVPLTTRALEALDATPRRLDVRLVFPGMRGGLLDLKNFRRSQWKPALDAAGIPHRRIYDMRHSFATWALDAGRRSSTSPVSWARRWR